MGMEVSWREREVSERSFATMYKKVVHIDTNLIRPVHAHPCSQSARYRDFEWVVKSGQSGQSEGAEHIYMRRRTFFACVAACRWY
jgi:hypothetical protein